ncbi:unnamed protein product [Timema podura]|uniref:Uncharacterized protein n=1 Tax=Timema podura TaxID=61482 RepID=A0ABN7NJK0_TIMPD|nr:unnamed protein product [Timema podura]
MRGEGRGKPAMEKGLGRLYFEEVYPHLCGERKIILTKSPLAHPTKIRTFTFVIDKSSALDHAATEADNSSLRQEFAPHLFSVHLDKLTEAAVANISLKLKRINILQVQVEII